LKFNYSFLLTLIIILSFLSAGYADFQGKKIVGIDFTGNVRAKEKELRTILNIKAGDLYSLKEIRRSLNLIYAKGIYENILVDAIEQDEGVFITYNLIGKYLVRKVRVKGNFPFLKDTILKEATIKINGEYITVQIESYVKRLISFFESQGYRKAIIKIEEDIDEETKDVELVIKIKRGFRTRIKDVQIQGRAYYSDNKIRRKSRLFYFIPFLMKGKILKKPTLDGSIEKLENFYQKKEFYQSEIDKPKIIFDDKKNKADIILKIEAGINVHFEIKGNFIWMKMHKNEIIKSLIRITKQYIYDEQTYVDKLIKKINIYFEDLGFCNCNVLSNITKQGEHVFLKFSVDVRNRIEIEELKIVGNDKVEFPDKKIQKLMLSKANNMINTPSKYFAPKTIKEDLNNIVSYYHTKGYLKASAEYELTRREDDVNKGSILIKIDQGEQTLVSAIYLKGNVAFSDEILESLLEFKENDPFDAGKAINGAKKIMSFYLAKGYANCQVEEKHTIDMKANTAEVNYEIVEGDRFRFGKIIIEKLPKTRRGIILKNITFKEDDNYSYKLLESSQKSLYKTKLFDRIDFETLDYKDRKDVVYKLKEKNRAIFDFTLGYNESEGLDFISTGYLINPFSLGTTFGGNIEFSDIKESYKVTFSKSKYKFGIYSHLLYLRLEKDSYSVKTFGFNLEFKKRFLEWLEGAIGYNYDSSELFDVQPEAILEWEDEGHVNVGSLIFSNVVDKRNDPFNTTRGFFCSFSTEYASKYFGSKTNPEATIEYHFLPEEQAVKAEPLSLGFFKFHFKTAVYLPVTSNFVFALSVQAGTAYSYEGPDILPIHKRFFLGGSTTVRGYTLDTVQSDSVKALKPYAKPETPIGGNGMFCGNVELRYEFIDKWWFVLFSDMGNVWADIGEFGKIRDDMRHTVGAGFRWITPIGPLRFDYGLKLEREEGESMGEWYITLGHTF